MLTFTTFRSCSSAIRSRTGETAWHGPHHSAQKSTITLPPVLSTSVSNVSLVALVAIPSFPLMSYSVPNVAAGAFVPDPGTVRTHVYAPTGQARSPHARGGDPRALGAGGDLRAAPRAQSRRPDLVVRRRPRDGEQAGTGGAHRLGSHAQGRLPAVQGASRLRPALPERLRLPGPLDRGRRRTGARPELEAGDRGVRARELRPQVPRGRDQVVRGARAGSKRLGQWMDWGNDYFTFSDTNIEYIWKFLKIVNERGWLYIGHRSTEWCPRCGTSLSQHELTQGGVYQERADPSLYVRLKLLDRKGQSLVVWTTTPWTLPANVAAAVHPDEEYGRRENGEWVAVKLFPDDRYVERLRGSELVGWRYRGPFDDLAPGSAVEHRVIPWDDVTMDQGTGVVHIAPGCGGEDFELSKVHDLDVLTPVDESGRFYEDYGWLHGLSTAESADQIIGRLGEQGLVVESGLYTHAYPHCWRCDTPLIFRLSDDWFISVEEIRPKLLEENAKVQWVPEYMGKRMDDWLRNMGDWNISRRRYYGLPLPFYPCPCGHLNVVGSKHELGERATEGFDELEELRRPWVDRVPITCESCDGVVTRVPEVGDVWLDAGIVPFSTLGWENPEWIKEGYATGAARGLTHADLPDHSYWETWFPADWVTEMREQIRLWFYSQFFMSVVLVGTSPYKRVLGYEKMLDEQGREMHGSWGNMIKAEDAFDQMGADVMRWQFCAQPPDRNLLFGYGPAHEIK